MWGVPIRRAQAIAMSLSFAYMMYTALGFFTNCKSPVVVVLSGSMEPGIHRGDLLFLSNYAPYDYKNGDITVYQIARESITIVHRVVQTHAGPKDSSRLLLTKGDNNELDDLSLYQGLEWLEPKHVVGRVRAIIPLVGYLSILVNEYPRLRYAIFGIMGLVNILHS
ncbi:Signal peptidase complex catalytic subunit SEC11 [Mycena sanguinolenta]|uniref:Signal peptidase complex catalytic subunit SEC11 n=1 Tax=Mycena sanguinolenta TaxID=230812 RepID=A0A8H7DLN9_9AGAR|nr:Signal peptidase complex catalytic subunit SEC11 [Mycena sanguinolenta]